MEPFGDVPFWYSFVEDRTDNHTTTYGYDGTGMRISKTQGSSTIKYYWDRGYIVNEYVETTPDATNYIGLSGIFARENSITQSHTLSPTP